MFFFFFLIFFLNFTVIFHSFNIEYCLKSMKFWIIKIRRFQDNVCPLIFEPFLSCLQWQIKPLVGQITDETAATINK